MSASAALGVGTIAALLVGCAGVPPTVPIHSSRSWMLPEAKTKNLIYVVDGGTDVDVLTFPGYKLVGTLTGFSESTGVCSDTHGNVWIANAGTESLIEYAHGGTTPIATLDDPNQYPISCAFDPKSGDLAVSNLSVAPSLPDNIGIYARESGPPVLYPDPKLNPILYLSYGPGSRLFFDGTIGTGKFAMARFVEGTFTRIRIRGAKITSGIGGVQYADGMLTTTAHGYGQTALIYQMSDSGTITGTTQLLGAYSCQGYLIWKNVVICPSSYNNLLVYRYPQGGNYTQKVAVHFYPIQAAMSTAVTRWKRRRRRNRRDSQRGAAHGRRRVRDRFL
jgi:hypothetical protein